MKVAVYPGTFDPVTYGHLDLLKRSVKLFDKIIVGVAESGNKNCLFPLHERVEMVKLAIKEENMESENIEVKGFSNLLIDFVKENDSKIILRGLRALSDFEFEFQNAITNRKLDEKIESVFIMTSENYFYLTSSMVKEIASFKGDISLFVPKLVIKKIEGKFK